MHVRCYLQKVQALLLLCHATEREGETEDLEDLQLESNWD